MMKLLTFITLLLPLMRKPHLPAPPLTKEGKLLSVLSVKQGNNTQPYAKVSFNEMAPQFRLSKKLPAYPAYLSLLENAQKKKIPVYISFSKTNYRYIETVTPAPETIIAEWKKQH
jgi:hypothetical protein